MAGTTEAERALRRDVANELRDMGTDPFARLTTPEAAEWLRLKPNTLERLRSRNLGPRCTYSGGKALYRAIDLELWTIAETERRRQQRRYAAAHEAAEAR